MITARKYVVALFVERSCQQWVVWWELDGNFYLPS